MLTIRCAKCRKRVFRYDKVGEGRLLHCWKERVVEDRSVRTGREVRCKCGSLIGLDEGKWIKMKRNSFTRSGTVSNR